MKIVYAIVLSVVLCGFGFAQSDDGAPDQGLPDDAQVQSSTSSTASEPDQKYMVCDPSDKLGGQCRLRDTAPPPDAIISVDHSLPHEPYIPSYPTTNFDFYDGSRPLTDMNYAPVGEAAKEFFRDTSIDTLVKAVSGRKIPLSVAAAIQELGTAGFASFLLKAGLTSAAELVESEPFGLAVGACLTYLKHSLPQANFDPNAMCPVDGQTPKYDFGQSQPAYNFNPYPPPGYNPCKPGASDPFCPGGFGASTSPYNSSSANSGGGSQTSPAPASKVTAPAKSQSTCSAQQVRACLNGCCISKR